jgi:hypothetical protein
MVSPSRRQVPFAFPTSREMNHLFHAIDKMNPPEREKITIESWIIFICQCDKDFDSNKEFQRILKEEMSHRFGSELDPGEFPKAFDQCCRLIGQLKRTGKVEGIFRMRKPTVSAMNQPEDEDFDEDAIDDSPPAESVGNGEKESGQRSEPIANPPEPPRKDPQPPMQPSDDSPPKQPNDDQVSRESVGSVKLFV